MFFMVTSGGSSVVSDDDGGQIGKSHLCTSQVGGRFRFAAAAPTADGNKRSPEPPASSR